MDKDKVVFDVPIATADPGTSSVRVKREKPDSPQASARAVTNPKSTPFPSMVRLGYLSQNQAVANTSKMAGKVLVRFQCTLCSKTFSRSGTLKVNVYFRTYTCPRQSMPSVAGTVDIFPRLVLDDCFCLVQLLRKSRNLSHTCQRVCS